MFVTSDKQRAWRKAWRERNPEKCRLFQRNWAAKNPEKAAEASRRKRRERKLRVFEAYGGAICVCCGESDLFFLTLDHVANDGADHRREIGLAGRGVGDKIYRWIIKNGFPPGFQVLCMNCNWGKARNGGVCPHEATRWPSDAAVHF